jgi:hypothetical protein
MESSTRLGCVCGDDGGGRNVLVVEDEEGEAFGLLLLPEEVDRDHPLEVLLRFQVRLDTRTHTKHTKHNM